jgi:hypothetical protein
MTDDELDKCLSYVWRPWRVLETWEDPATCEVHARVAVSSLVLRQARDPAELAVQLAPNPIPRRFYTGRYAPRAAMRRRVGL